jgi:gamma-glutamylputrescine oxidase
MLSFWEKESFLKYDTIIIGSGIVGLSTAISIKEKSPQQSVLVLERGLFPTGASTRNAGFACFGSLSEILADLEKSGEEKTLEIVEKRIRGLSRLRGRLGDEAMDYQPVGGYELIFDKELQALENIEKANDLLKNIFPGGVYTDQPALVKKFGFNNNQVRSMVFNPYEGHVHTGKMMHALMQMAQEKGVEIRTGAEVLDIEENDAFVNVFVNEPMRGRISFQAQKVAVCTNAFTTKLLSGICISPARGQVIITKPVADLAWEGTFHFDEGFYYFRNVGKRVLFGGGRNLAFEEETADNFDYNENILAELVRLLHEIILPGKQFEIEQRWSGIMGFSEDKQPIIKKHSARIVLGFACNGMGVSLSGTVGDAVADLVLC